MSFVQLDILDLHLKCVRWKQVVICEYESTQDTDASALTAGLKPDSTVRVKCCDTSRMHAPVNKQVLRKLWRCVSLSNTKAEQPLRLFFFFFFSPSADNIVRYFVQVCVSYLLSVLSDGRSGLNKRQRASVCVLQKTCRPILTATHTHTGLVWLAHLMNDTYTHARWCVLTAVLSVWLQWKRLRDTSQSVHLITAVTKSRFTGRWGLQWMEISIYINYIVQILVAHCNGDFTMLCLGQISASWRSFVSYQATGWATLASSVVA